MLMISFRTTENKIHQGMTNRNGMKKSMEVSGSLINTTHLKSNILAVQQNGFYPHFIYIIYI